MRRMPPDGLCLYHCLLYAANPGAYDAWEPASAAAAAEDLRQRIIAKFYSVGASDQGDRLGQSGSAGYPQEEDFAMISQVTKLPFEIIIESAPAMQPLRYGEGDAVARFVLREIFDGAGAVSMHWDVAEIFTSHKRRRITEKQSVVLRILPEVSRAAESGRADDMADCSIPDDIARMNEEVGEFIHGLGKTHDVTVFQRLRAEGYAYTRSQVRVWKQHYGSARDVETMENAVGDLIRGYGKEGYREVHRMLHEAGHSYSTHQIRKWKQLYGNRPTAEVDMDLDAEGMLKDHSEELRAAIESEMGFTRLATATRGRGYRISDFHVRW